MKKLLTLLLFSVCTFGFSQTTPDWNMTLRVDNNAMGVKIYGMTMTQTDSLRINIPIVSTGDSVLIRENNIIKYRLAYITGSTGATGSAGSIGSTGATGTNGTIGSDGATGSTGANGADGIIGTTGATGANGAIGSTGSTGSAGSTGVTGADGAIGANGSTGSTGADGKDGVTGSTGSTGSDGSVTALSAIGSTPNANGATLTGTALNLEPASVSFGGGGYDRNAINGWSKNIYNIFNNAIDNWWCWCWK